jgi:putative transposase
VAIGTSPYFSKPTTIASIVGLSTRRRGAVWAYCLMPNHVHLIAIPADADGLRATFAEAHRRYTGVINARF